jgi:hypothetical protein
MKRGALVVEAVAVLKAVAGEAASPELVARIARELETAWARMPWTLGLRGDALHDRTAVLDFLAGGGVLGTRAPGCATIRLRRGERTRFVARRERGPAEEGAAVAGWTRATTPAQAASFAARIAGWFRRRRAEPADGFVTRLRELSAGAGNGEGTRVVEIVVELAGGPLAANLEVVELADAGDARELDAVVVVAGARLALADRDTTPLGDHRRATAALAELVEVARAVRIATRALDAAAEVVAAADAKDRVASADFAGRVADLEDLRIADPAGFARAQIDRVRAQIHPSVTAVMEHVAAHLNADLAQLGAEWRTAIERVSTSGELGDAVASINETSAASVRRIAEDARILVMGGVAGCVRDLCADVIAPLCKQGLSEELARVRTTTTPVLATPVLPSLASPSGTSVGSAGWFAALFRSLETRRADIRDKVEHHIARLEEVAVAEMRDAEPTLRAAIEAALTNELGAAIDRQRAWLDGAIAVEHAEFAMRSEAIADRTARIDAARRDVGRLRDEVARAAARRR